MKQINGVFIFIILIFIVKGEKYFFINFNKFVKNQRERVE